MSHQPAIPAASQSPYPLHPAPLSHRADEASFVSDDDERAGRSWNPGTKAGIGAAVGIGSAALVAALLYARRRPSSATSTRSSATDKARAGSGAGR